PSQQHQQILDELQRMLQPQMTATGRTDPIEALGTMAQRGDARAVQLLGLMVLRPELMEAQGRQLWPGPIINQQDAAGRMLTQLASGQAPDLTRQDRRMTDVPRDVQQAAAAECAYARLMRDSTAFGPNTEERRRFERVEAMRAQDGPENRNRWLQTLVDD